MSISLEIRRPDISLRAFALGACKRARKAGYESDIKSVRRLDEHLTRLGYQCYWCGGPFEVFDHMTPLSLGGKDMLANVAPCCRACNETKSDTPLSEWLAFVAHRAAGYRPDPEVSS